MHCHTFSVHFICFKLIFCLFVIYNSTVCHKHFNKKLFIRRVGGQNDKIIISISICVCFSFWFISSFHFYLIFTANSFRWLYNFIDSMNRWSVYIHFEKLKPSRKSLTRKNHSEMANGNVKFVHANTLNDFNLVEWQRSV